MRLCIHKIGTVKKNHVPLTNLLIPQETVGQENSQLKLRTLVTEQLFPRYMSSTLNSVSLPKGLLSILTISQSSEHTEITAKITTVMYTLFSFGEKCIFSVKLNSTNCLYKELDGRRQNITDSLRIEILEWNQTCPIILCLLISLLWYNPDGQSKQK